MRHSDKDILSLIKSEEAFAQFQPGNEFFSRITEAELGPESLVQPGSTHFDKPHFY